MPPLVIAAVGATIAIGGSIIKAKAEGAAGDAKLSAAEQERQDAIDAVQKQIDIRADAVATAQKAASMSPGEIDSIQKILATRDQALQAGLSSLNKQQANLDAMDPNVKAAGSNLYDLLSGKSAAILGPMQQQMDLQRKNLQSQLASQMGPGYMTSSAGIQALTTFDNQAAMTMGQAQMGAIQMIGGQFAGLSGMQQQGQAQLTASTNSVYGQAQAASGMALQGYEAAQNRYSAATNNALASNQINPGMVPAAQADVVNHAGDPWAGTIGLGQTLTGVGAGMMKSGLSGGMGGGGDGGGDGGGGGAGMGAMAGMSAGNAGGGSSYMASNPFTPQAGSTGAAAGSFGTQYSSGVVPQGTGAYGNPWRG